MDERRSALIIANSEYEDPGLRKLAAPAHDAEALERVLADPEVGCFEVKALLNRPAREVSVAIERFFLNRKRDDLLLVYYSGHGLRDDDGQLYLAAVDTQLIEGVRPLRATAVGASFVRDIMQDSGCRRQVLVLDCCYSGAFAKALMAKGGAALTIQDQFEQGRGLVLLTASAAIQPSFEGEGAGAASVFTHHLVQGIETGAADGDGDGLVSLDELYEYIHDRVTDENPQQRPMKWAFDVEGEIVFAQVPKAALKPAELSPELQQAIGSTFVSLREDAVRELELLLRGKHKGRVLAAYEALLKLIKDDSRRVAAAAERCLAAYDEEQRQERERADAVERERQEEERAEQEQLAREKAQQERLKAEAECAARPTAEQERQEQEEAERERLVRQKAEAEHRAAEEAAARQTAEQERQEREGAEAAELVRASATRVTVSPPPAVSSPQPERLPAPRRNVEVFFSYSHKDESLRDQLEQHLAGLKRQDLVSAWHDRKIGVGQVWAQAIDQHLNTADVILLLISADFVASDFCFGRELARALERHERREAVVIPIILRPVDLTGTPFMKLQALPKDARPVTMWPNVDEAFADVAKGIRAVVVELAGRLKAEAERAAQEKAEKERQERERAEAAERQRRAEAQAEQERLAREKAEQERLKAEAERAAQQKAEKERQERERTEAAERQRRAKAQAEQERLTREKAEQERLTAAAERAVQQKAEQERQERERAEAAERQRRAEAQAEQERVVRPKAKPELPTSHVAIGTAAPGWGAGVGVGAVPAKMTKATPPPAVAAPDAPVPTEASRVQAAASAASPAIAVSDVSNLNTIEHFARRHWQWLASAVIIPTVVWSFGAVGTYLRTRAAINRGDSYYAKGAYAEALRTYQNGLARNSENSVLRAKVKQTRDAMAALGRSQIEALTRQGDSYYVKGAYREAINEYKEALNLDPKNQVLQHKVQQAEDAFASRVLVYHGPGVSDIMNQGDSFYANGAYDKAIGEYQKALNLDPKNPALQEKIQQARNAMASALQKQVGDLINQGDSYYVKGAYGQAIRDYQTALKLDPQNPVLQERLQRGRKKQIDALIRGGDTDYENAQYGDAIGQYMRAQALDPSNAALLQRMERARKAKATEDRLLKYR